MVLELLTLCLLSICPTDLVEGNQRSKLRSEKCSAVNRYIFNWEAIAEQVTPKHLEVQRGILRLYLQVIPRLLDGISTDVDVTITANLFNGSYHNSSDAVFAGERYLNVSGNSNGWVELDVTEGLKALWPPTIENSKIEFVIRLAVNCNDKKKIPATFIDPSEIPLGQENRRQRHLSLQPLLVVYISDNDVKRILENEQKEEIVDSESLRLVDPQQRRKRNSFESCDVENFTIVFHDIGLEHVIEPYSYNIKQCSGPCSHTAIKRNGNIASNHAKVMASAHLVEQLQPQTFETEPDQPCCVPVKYSSINLLIRHRNNALELSIFPNFEVQKCGCR